MSMSFAAGGRREVARKRRWRPWRHARQWAAQAACLALLLGGMRPLWAQPAERISDYQVKAAFLYNFAKFVEWPPEALRGPEETLRVCVLSDVNPFSGALEQMVAGKRVGGRSVAVVYLRQAAGTGRCHVLFISASENHHTAEVLKALEGQSTLTVGEEETFLRKGGIINFVVEEERVRFQVNLAAAERARLKVSARLLAVARGVVGGPMGRDN